MMQYKVFTHPSGQSEAVKQGWSWPAFFFGFIWAMVKKIWGLGIGFMIATIVLLSAQTAGVSEALINIVSLIVAIIFGMNGNSWREKNLISRGFEHMDTVTAANPDGAMALYLKAAAAAK